MQSGGRGGRGGRGGHGGRGGRGTGTPPNKAQLEASQLRSLLPDPVQALAARSQPSPGASGLSVKAQLEAFMHTQREVAEQEQAAERALEAERVFGEGRSQARDTELRLARELQAKVERAEAAKLAERARANKATAGHAAALSETNAARAEAAQARQRATEQELLFARQSQEAEARVQ